MSKPKYYISTAIAYTSSRPHIGNTYEIVLADSIARYKRMEGYDVYFQTGTDEHGQKIEEKANAAGITPKEYVDNVAKIVKANWDMMNTSYDKFIRTTDDYHEKQVQKIFKKLYRQTLGRPAPAAFDRTRRTEEPRDTDPRRGHLGTRYGERKTRAGCPQQAARRPHVGGYRPPPVDDPQRRQDHRRRPRPRGRAGHPHRTARKGRHLCQTDRIAVVRLKMPACTDERRKGKNAGGRMVRPA